MAKIGPFQDVKNSQSPPGATRFQDVKNSIPEFLSSSLKPRKIIVPLAEARHWRAGGNFLFQIKMDGRFEVIERDGYTMAAELMRDGTRYAHTLLGVPGQSLQNVNLREAMPELRRIVPRFQDVKIRLCPEFSGGEGLEAALAAGHEGGVAKDLDAPYGEMLCCKRIWEGLACVTGFCGGTQSVTIADAATGEPRGKIALRGGKIDRVRVGSVLKVQGMGLTERGLIREPRLCADAPDSWLVKF